MINKLNSPQKQVRFIESLIPSRTLKKKSDQITPNKPTEEDLFKQQNNMTENSQTQAGENSGKKNQQLKIDNINQNTQLSQENATLLKNFNSKKNESDIWKIKYETQMNTIIGMKANYELELKKMAQELRKYKETQKQDDKNTERYEKNVYNENISSLKKMQDHEIQNYDNELNKLKILIHQKNEEINALISQNRLQKVSYENLQNDLKNEIQVLQNKLYQLHIIKDDEFEVLKRQLENLHATDINNLKIKHDQNDLQLLMELDKLKILINVKSDELNNQIKENMQVRQTYSNENDRLKEEIEIMRLRSIQIIYDKEIYISDSIDKQSQQIRIHEEYVDQLKIQIKFLEDQIDSLKHCCVIKNNELEENTNKNRVIQTQNQEDIKKYRLDIQDLKNRLSSCELDKEKQLQEKEQIFNQMNKSNIEKFRKMDLQFNQQEIDIKKYKEANNILQVESQNIMQIKDQILQDLKNSQNTNDILYQKLSDLELIKVQQLEEIRTKMEGSYEFQINSLKQSTDNQITIISDQLQEQKTIVQNKDNQIEAFVGRLNDMEKIFMQLNQSNPRDYEQQIKQLGQQILTSKNLYDVFLQTQYRPKRLKSMHVQRCI